MELLSALFASVLTAKTAPWEYSTLDWKSGEWKTWSRRICSEVVFANWLHKNLWALTGCTHERELAEVIVKPLYHLGKVVENGRGACGLEESQCHSSEESGGCCTSISARLLILCSLPSSCNFQFYFHTKNKFAFVFFYSDPRLFILIKSMCLLSSWNDHSVFKYCDYICSQLKSEAFKVTVISLGS